MNEPTRPCIQAALITRTSVCLMGRASRDQARQAAKDVMKELVTWHQPAVVACAVPDGTMPAQVNGTPIRSWDGVPQAPEAWEALAAQEPVPEPPFEAPKGYKKSAGVVVREPDGRVWLIAPINGFAGYKATFPKGHLDGKSTQAAALTEAFEESGLQVRLIQHLVDVPRTTTYTRYFLAERVGGNPADMGWESQAVLLVPQAQLGEVATNGNDQAIIEALKHV